MIKTLEKQLINEFNISQDACDKLYKYYELLVEYSQKMNLTSIIDLEGVYLKHFYDSLLLSKVVDFKTNLRLVDVGTGAGFPGLVIKICYPNVDITLIEPTTKRCIFLQKVIDTLALKDVKIINDRAEKAIINYRNYFDIATARAVSNLNMLSELCVPFVKLTGLFTPLKGSSYEEEITNATSAFTKLKLKVVNTNLFELPNNQGTRAILTIKKEANTPNIYPREYAKIKKNPL